MDQAIVVYGALVLVYSSYFFYVSAARLTLYCSWLRQNYDYVSVVV